MVKKIAALAAFSILVFGSAGVGATGSRNHSMHVSKSTNSRVMHRESSSSSTMSSSSASSSSSSSSTTISSSSSSQSKITYVAMGDSVAAGLGLAPLATPSTIDNQCGRSSQGYPTIVAQQMNLKLLDLACSGSTTGDVKSNQLPIIYNRSVSPQLITITAGANDLHWVQILKTCYSANCATSTGAAFGTANRAVVKNNLMNIFSQIQTQSGNKPPMVVVTGYYNPVSNYCKGRQNLVSNTEINFLNGQRDAINQTIRDAASGYSFVRYASSNFTGHGLCASQPWSQGLNDNAPLHPTAQGQQQIANSVMNAINGNSTSDNGGTSSD